MSYLDILNERDGFGKNATGGANGPIYTVTSLADSGSGTLRDALSKSGALWINFGVSGTIALQSSLMMTSNKTIDGRGKSITLKGRGDYQVTPIRMIGISNVILLNLTLDDAWPNYTTDSEGADGIYITNSTDVWIHHCKFARWSDGAIDIKEGNVSRVSVTRCLFENIWQALAWQGTDLSLGYCFSKSVGARMPKAIDGQVVSYNNILYKWTNEGIQGVKGAKGELLAWRNMYRRGTLKDCNDRAEGKIQTTAPWFAEGLSDVNFVGGSDAVDRAFVDRVKAVCKVSTVGQTLYDQVMAKAGPTLPATSYTTTTPPPSDPTTKTLEERVADLEARVTALEG